MILFPQYIYEINTQSDRIEIKTNSYEELYILASFLGREMFIDLDLQSDIIVLKSIETFRERDDITDMENYRFYCAIFPQSADQPFLLSGDYLKLRYWFSERYKYDIDIDTKTGELCHLI